MNRESIIDQIRALRNLSQDKSTTLEEAAAAARVAEILIQKYMFAEADLELPVEMHEPIIEDSEFLTDWNMRQVSWQNVLIYGLSRAYSCVSVIKWKDHKLGMTAIGKASDLAILRYQYAFFTLELTRLAHALAPSDLKRGSGKHWHNSFYNGAVSALLDSLEKAKKEVSVNASSSALVTVNEHLKKVENFHRRLYPKAGSQVMKARFDSNAYQIGKQAGSNLSPKPGLNAGVRGLLGN